MEKIKKIIKECPIIIGVGAGALLLTVAAFALKDSTYATYSEETDSTAAPALAVALKGAQDGVFPWTEETSDSEMAEYAAPGENVVAEVALVSDGQQEGSVGGSVKDNDAAKGQSAGNGQSGAAGRNGGESGQNAGTGENGGESGQNAGTGENGGESGQNSGAGENGGESGQNADNGKNSDADMKLAVDNGKNVDAAEGQKDDNAKSDVALKGQIAGAEGQGQSQAAGAGQEAGQGQSQAAGADQTAAGVAGAGQEVASAAGQGQAAGAGQTAAGAAGAGQEVVSAADQGQAAAGQETAGSAGQGQEAGQGQAAGAAAQDQTAAANGQGQEAAASGPAVAGASGQDAQVTSAVAQSTAKPVVIPVVEDRVYSFTSVNDDYFSDALFIGDSRTVGLSEYCAPLDERAVFYAKVSMSIYDVMKKKFISSPNGKIGLEQALSENNFGKIYIMLGLNEIGTGTDEYFRDAYKGVIDRIRQLQPGAIIYIQGIMHVTGAKSAGEKYFNNERINSRNAAISTLADQKYVFYMDMNSAVDDESGNLQADISFDGVHLKASAYQKWYDFLLQHAIVR